MYKHQEALKVVRNDNPKMRRTGATAIEHSGGKQTIFGCVCGARHTAATSYRDARHVQDWIARHENCLLDVAEQITQRVLCENNWKSLSIAEARYLLDAWKNGSQKISLDEYLVFRWLICDDRMEWLNQQSLTDD